MRNFGQAYETIEETSLKDIHSVGYLVRHKKSGAVLTLISNNDENKVFYIGFRTPPKDSTGVAHIIEHTVLNGSEKYPLKDPFVELVKGSLNTFLNAMTYPDKTLYPVASTNMQDFKNLMDVYMDAVFHPNIYKYPEVFRQEGWHYELNDRDSELKINGVVYNEMKGAFSSPDDVLERKILNSLFPNTPYSNESGGDPDVIPTLKREDYLNFHRKYYRPSNSYIYLYGDMDFDERLNYLDKEYLGQYEKSEVDSDIPLEKPFSKPVFVEGKYSVNSDESTDKKTYLSWNKAVGTSGESELSCALSILDYALISSQGAPLTKALLDAGIGEDVYGGYDNGTRQGVFSVIAKNADKDQEEEFIKIIKDTLTEVRDKGLDRDVLRAGIESAKFRFLESDFGSAPKGLIYGLNIMDTWLYEKDKPFDQLFAAEYYDRLLEKLDSNYFEDIIDKYLINNTHCAIVSILPEPGLTIKKEKALAEKLASYKASLSNEELDKLIFETKELKKFQEEPTPEEDLKKIPMLKREDLRRSVRKLNGHLHEENGIKILHSNVETNGIHYLEVDFLPKGLHEEDIPLLSFYSKVLGAVDTEKHSYKELGTDENIYTGGIIVNTKVYPVIGKEPVFSFYIRTKMFYSNEKKGEELLDEILFESKLDDKNRIKEILLQEKSSLEDSLQSSGNTTAAMRAGSYYDYAARLGDEISGISYYRFISAMANDFDKEYDKFLKKVEDIKPLIFRPENLFISTTGRDEAFCAVKDYIPSLLSRLEAFRDIDVKGNPGSIISDGRPEVRKPEEVNEGFMTTGQVQYVCRAGDFKKAGFEYSGALNILKVMLGYDYFWINVRVKGGAYGCGGNFMRNGSVFFTSYRDPDLAKTIDIFNKTDEYLLNFDADERTMTKYIIGTMSSVDTPLTPKQLGLRDLSAYFYGIDEKELQKERDSILDARPEDIRALAPMVKEAMKDGYLCVIGSESKIKSESERFAKVKKLD
jgi:hypothetical protein